MSEAGNRKLPDTAIEKAKQMILDTFAAMISGSDLPPGRFAIGFARAYGGDAISTVAGSNVVCGPIGAALANGMLAHSDETDDTDDTHPPSESHPGSSVVPSALAVGEKFDIDGARFIRAVVPGYDIGPRVTATLGKLEYIADAMAALMDGAGGIRPGLMAEGHRSYRKGLRLCGYAGAQRRYRCFAGAGGRKPASTMSSRARTISSRRSDARSLDAHGQVGGTLRDRSYERQEVDRGIADSGAARRAR